MDNLAPAGWPSKIVSKKIGRLSQLENVVEKFHLEDSLCFCILLPLSSNLTGEGGYSKPAAVVSADFTLGYFYKILQAVYRIQNFSDISSYF